MVRYFGRAIPAEFVVQIEVELLLEGLASGHIRRHAFWPFPVRMP